MKAIIELMRLDKPIGIFLLWYPTFWALCLAYGKHIPFNYLILFTLGTIIMRSAGCVINDIADRNWDRFVWRTKDRPLANGRISLEIAWGLLITLLLIALVILIQLPKNCFYVALAAVGLTLVYPFCKRFIRTPQLILSLAFASSIPMVCVAAASNWDISWTLLLCLTLMWVFAYDTAYALADMEDDKKLGILSSALFLGKYAKASIYGLQILLHTLWLGIAYLHQFTLCFYLLWFMASLFGCYQAYLLKQNKAALALQAFKNNHYYGLVMSIALYFGQ
jgi:4-hydroxybenzoate polyprenyltransferase